MHTSSGSTTPRALRARLLRTSRIMIGMAALGLAAACSADQTVGPSVDVERRDGLLGGLVGGLLGTVNNLLTDVTSVLRLTPVAKPVVVSKTFTREGGELRIPELGFALNVPANAIPGSSLKITVTALPGKAVAYDFAPHGTKFLKPLTFSQDLRNTNGLLGLLVRPNLSGGYFKNNGQVDTQTGRAQIDETIPLRMQGNTVTFEIHHFSGYLVSTGRSSGARDESNGYSEASF